MNNKNLRFLTEAAIMIALATVLSLLEIKMPFGGGLTICSMLPIVLMSHRWGWKYGLIVGFVYSIIQMLFGINNVGYADSFIMGVGIVMLDYVLAYTVIGLSGVFDLVLGKTLKSVCMGILVTFLLRLLCHFISGGWIWGVWMPEEFMNMTMTNEWVYSILYNGWYMLGEIVVTEIVTIAIYKPLGKYFRGEDLAKFKTNKAV